jgi:hypothetical protein
MRCPASAAHEKGLLKIQHQMAKLMDDRNAARTIEEKARIVGQINGSQAAIDALMADFEAHKRGCQNH